MALEISKSEFKAAYFRHSTPDSGWTEAYWNSNFEHEEGKKYYYDPPKLPDATRVFIISDKTSHRMIFLTEEAEESFFRN